MTNTKIQIEKTIVGDKKKSSYIPKKSRLLITYEIVLCT